MKRTRRMKLTKTVPVIFTLLIFLSAIFNLNLIKKAEASPGFTVYITPTVNSYPPSSNPTQNFTITVNVRDAPGTPPNIGIHSYEFYIYWNPSILKCLKAVKGSWLSKSGTYTSYFLPIINNTIGRIWALESLQGENVQTGSGTLATLTFQALQPGLTKLDLNSPRMILRYLPGTSWEYVYPGLEVGYFQYPLTTVTFQPENTFQAQGYNFTSNITATNLYNLKTWTMNLTWNPSILNLTQVQEGPWNTTSPTTFNYTLHSELGQLSLNSTVQTPNGETGNKTLATLTFQALAKGYSDLNITSPVLLDKNAVPHQLITIPGTFISIPKISTVPRSILDPNLKVGHEVNLNLTIINVDNLNRWSLNLSWDPNVVNFTSALEGPFLSSISETNFTKTVNQEQGSVMLNCNTTAGQGVNGTGLLATVKFTVKFGGKFKFKILNSTLTDVNGEDISHAVDAQVDFDNKVHDVAITAIQLSSQEVKQKQNITIIVTVLNNGTITENFTLTLKFGREVIESASIQNLQPSATKAIETEFDVGELPGDLYEVKAQITYLINEQDYKNNIKSEMLTVAALPQGFTIGWEIIVPIVIIIVAIVLAALYLRMRPQKSRT